MAPRCSATTRAGTECKRPALSGEDLCWCHSPETTQERVDRATRSGRTWSRKANDPARDEQLSKVTRQRKQRARQKWAEMDVNAALERLLKGLGAPK